MWNTSGMYLLCGIRQENQILKVYKQNRPVYARRFFIIFFFPMEKRQPQEKRKREIDKRTPRH